MIQEFKTVLEEFEKYIAQKTNRKLSNVQLIVEFYFFLIEADKMSIKPPFSRYVRSAKKIDGWTKGDTKKALGAIWDIKMYLEDRNLNWTLDTICRFVASYETGGIDHEHEIFSGSDIEIWEREKTQKMLREYRRFKKQKK
jgi:hypothetical protein